MTKRQNAVQVRNVRKQFSYSNHKNSSLKRAITQIFKPKDRSKDTFFALDGISFDIKQGDFFGILGRNGSGKSTLLKIISEIYQPTSGTVSHKGKLVSFIELGVGFKSELTGRENVFLNAALLGFSKQETEAMYDEIVEFAELEKFMDQKLKNYSSGMKVRLAFSVAIRSKSDILILDEVLAVGDAAFKKKSNEYFLSLKDTGQTIILVTHSMTNVKKFCNRAIVIENGKITFEGDPSEAAARYLDLFESDKANPVDSQKGDSKAAYIKNHGVSCGDKSSSVMLTIAANEPVSNLKIVVKIKNSRGNTIAGFSSTQDGDDTGMTLNEGERSDVNLTFDNLLRDGRYIIRAELKSVNDLKTYDTIDINTTLSGPSDMPSYRVTLPVSVNIE